MACGVWHKQTSLFVLEAISSMLLLNRETLPG
jgi:hypothetical protein